MEDWTLKRQIGHQAKIEYTFPSDYVLSAGKTVTVRAGVHFYKIVDKECSFEILVNEMQANVTKLLINLRYLDS